MRTKRKNRASEFFRFFLYHNEERSRQGIIEKMEKAQTVRPSEAIRRKQFENIRKQYFTTGKGKKVSPAVKPAKRQGGKRRLRRIPRGNNRNKQTAKKVVDRFKKIFVDNPKTKLGDVILGVIVVSLLGVFLVLFFRKQSCESKNINVKCGPGTKQNFYETECVPILNNCGEGTTKLKYKVPFFTDIDGKTLLKYAEIDSCVPTEPAPPPPQL
ncbi:MAG: hypothetical protein CMD68_00045 [Gammaproteobacteria bacterium]|nr:hypothetical protein [Gammaproteobacteria bacterium]